MKDDSVKPAAKATIAGGGPATATISDPHLYFRKGMMGAPPYRFEVDLSFAESSILSGRTITVSTGICTISFTRLPATPGVTSINDFRALDFGEFGSYQSEFTVRILNTLGIVLASATKLSKEAEEEK